MKKLLAMVLALVMVLGLVACGGNEPDSSNPPPSTDPMSDTTATTAPRELTTLEKLLQKDEEGIPAFAKRDCPFHLDELTDNEAISLACHMGTFMNTNQFVQSPQRYEFTLADRWEDLLTYTRYEDETTLSNMESIFHTAFQRTLNKGVKYHQLMGFMKVPCKDLIRDFYNAEYSVAYLHVIYPSLNIFDEGEMHDLVNNIRSNSAFDYDANLYLTMAVWNDGYVRDVAMYKLREMTQANWSLSPDENVNYNAQVIMLNAFKSDSWMLWGDYRLSEEELHELRRNVMNNTSVDLASKLIHFCLSDNAAAAEYGWYCAVEVATAAGNLEQDSETKQMMLDAIEKLISHEKFLNWEMSWELQRLSGLLK